METLFVSSLNANLALAWVICIVLLLRLIFKRISKRLCLFLWLIVGLRCVLPFSFHSTFSFLIPVICMDTVLRFIPAFILLMNMLMIIWEIIILKAYQYRWKQC